MIVRGILEARGPATAFNGSIAICDIATAQAAFGIDRQAVAHRPDRSGRVARSSRSRSVLPPSARIERPSRRNERVEKMLRAFRVNLFALAGVALLVGMFLVYNTVLISILRRRKDVGVLKTLGASPRQIFGAFLLEGLLFGAGRLGRSASPSARPGVRDPALIGRTINALYVTSHPRRSR